ncbi:MAG: ABC transporter ATP-binding protein, partial [Thermoplasmata archaeon]
TRKDSIQRTHEVLDFVGLGEERYRPIKSYSTGMKQKVKLAQAIVHDPSILFLDEPTNGLDPQGRDEMLDLIRRIGASGKTILVSSHILHEIEQVSQHIIIINEGALVREGTTASLMYGTENQYRVRLRGTKEQIAAFLKAIAPSFDVLDSKDESGQVSLLIQGEGGSSVIFAEAEKAGVQVRYFGPDTLSLEDVFVSTFRGGEPGGD